MMPISKMQSPSMLCWVGAPAAPRGGRGRRGRGAAVQPIAQQPILRPGPPSLQPFLSVTWLSLLNESSPGSHLQGRTLAFLYGYLGSKTRSSTRDDSGSDVRTGMECLVGYLTAWARAPALGPEALAKKIPGFITSEALCANIFVCVFLTHSFGEVRSTAADGCGRVKSENFRARRRRRKNSNIKLSWS
eukprot:scaffold5985_cov112-Isochrysis_galbana.AAC.4